ncbi:heat shock protein DnaJ domain protein [Crinalium epipsammum PCC 9333]|uniref:Heat shock protein DnaJ domain protein n=1 Tax=Crinalium epipsammum PCC 9333 TaxID=1173022 RepID=K9VYP9_9CYAN|nr:DnaJ domain-containing protein [Crinalium epipsammum]AFZ12664.1 heat shock protein DnaJ domain protein [Crinalium epipsammum PCC 9333]
MKASNHYETLEVSTTATPEEIKQSYRRLVKLFHPDSKSETADHEQIVRINVAYEVLGDSQRRRSYDQQLNQTFQGKRQQRTANVENNYRHHRQRGQEADEHLQLWIKQVYLPVNRWVYSILTPLREQLDALSADPFDDELMAEFQDYLTDCRLYLNQAQVAFRSFPNPATMAGVAAHLYYCLNQLGDGIEELNFFTLNYDDHYLHTGQELFRIAAGLRREAQHAMKTVA